MKSSEIRKFTKDELVNKYKESVTELGKIRISLKSGEITGELINRTRELKKDIARIQTILSELELVS